MNKKPAASNTKRNSIVSVTSTSTLINTSSNILTTNTNQNTYANKNLKTYKKNLTLKEGSSSSPKQSKLKLIIYFYFKLIYFNFIKFR